MPQTKTELRRLMRQMRKSLSLSERGVAALAVCERLCAMPLYQKATVIAGYMPFDNELDPTPIMKMAWTSHKSVTLPCLSTEGDLHFRLVEANSVLQANQFGILEPQNTDVIDTNDIAIILVPLVAFDTHCNRLGLGAGYYDKTMGHSRRKETILIGLGYEFQRTNCIETDSWDVTMDYIVTDMALYSCTGARSDK